MTNFKEFIRLISFTRNKLCNYSLITRDYAYLSCGRYTPVQCAKNSYFIFKNSTFEHKNDLLTSVSLSKNICTSKVINSKSKDRGGKEKKKTKAVKLDLREVSEYFDIDDLTMQMNQAIDNMKTDFVKNLTLRSTTGSLEQILVKVDGKEYQLQELAQISRKPKIVVLNVAAFPTAIIPIIKAIETSGLNINPQQDGTTLFLPIPKVTKEHRENLSKGAKAIFIRHRDEIKEIRNKVLKTLKRRKDISEDILHRLQGQIEALCDKYIREAEMILESKQNELLGSS